MKEMERETQYASTSHRVGPKEVADFTFLFKHDINAGLFAYNASQDI